MRNALSIGLCCVVFAALLAAVAAAGQTDPLPSWHDTATKKAIVTFVERVTQQGLLDFVPP